MLIPFKNLLHEFQIQPLGVFHGGGNLAQEAKDYYDYGVKRTLWVEAIPSVYNEMVENLKPYPNVTTVCACLSDVDGQEVDFHIADNEGQSSSMLEFGTHSIEHPTVHFIDTIKLKTSCVDTLVNTLHINIYNYDFLNFDLQGAELLALKGMGTMLNNFKWLYLEVNDKELYKGCPLVKDIDNYVSQFGFVGRKTKMTNFGWGDKFYTK